MRLGHESYYAHCDMQQSIMVVDDASLSAAHFRGPFVGHGYLWVWLRCKRSVHDTRIDDLDLKAILPEHQALQLFCDTWFLETGAGWNQSSAHGAFEWIPLQKCLGIGGPARGGGSVGVDLVTDCAWQ